MQTQTTTMSLDAYFEFEYNATERHEYTGVAPRAFAYTSVNHGRIVANIFKKIASCIDDKNCMVYVGDRMLYAEECKRVFYPDLLIVCDDEKFYNYKGKMQATLNPRILIEVLSDSTKDIDYNEKWHCYKKITSVEQYIIVSQDKKLVELYERLQNNIWKIQDFEQNEDEFKIGDCAIKLSDIYKNVPIDDDDFEGESVSE